jgi:hypothetical protein
MRLRPSSIVLSFFCENLTDNVHLEIKRSYEGDPEPAVTRADLSTVSELFVMLCGPM